MLVKSFLMNPLLCLIITNTLFLLVLSAIGFAIGIGTSLKCNLKIVFINISKILPKNITKKYHLINLKAIKHYGDHCKTDFECSSKFNYKCQNGVCSCSSETFYKSEIEGCG